MTINPKQQAATQPPASTKHTQQPHHSPEVRNAASGPVLVVPLHLETRAALSTLEAAAHLNRRPQTLRTWACFENGPVRPVRVNGRLSWPVNEIKRALGVQQ